MPIIDLKNLQEKAAPFFEKWKIANSKDEGKDKRTRIYQAVKSAIHSDDLNTRGIYCFVRLAEPDGISRIQYIGIVSEDNRTLKERMWDHLAKEYTSLRPELLEISEQEAERNIRSLIATLHKDHMIDKYTKTHMKGRRMSRSDAIFLYPTSTASSKIIKEVETALIQAARPLPGEQHELVNSQKIKGRKKISIAATDLARHAITAWKAEGIGNITSQEWLLRLSEGEASSP